MANIFVTPFGTFACKYGAVFGWVWVQRLRVIDSYEYLIVRIAELPHIR